MSPTRPTGPRDRLREALGWRPVAPPDHPVLFINPRSGGGTAVRLSLDRRARERGIEPVVLESGQDLSAVVADAVGRGADALGMAGGDGSLAVVAAAAGTHGLPFVCVPAGTRNHFARDLGVPRRDVEGALDAFTAGLERSIDLGEVNGRPFLDNVVLGFYGDAVRREGYRDARMRTLLVAARDAPRTARADLRGSPWWTIRAASTGTRRSSSCPTTRMPSSTRSRARRGRGSTAAGSVSSSSCRPPRCRRRSPPEPRPPSKSRRTGPRAPASTAGTPPVGFELRRDRDLCGAPRRGVRRARPSGAERSSRASAASAACPGRMAQGCARARR
jgi:hypothetical protein